MYFCSVGGLTDYVTSEPRLGKATRSSFGIAQKAGASWRCGLPPARGFVR